MSTKEGVLRRQSNRRWAIVRPDHDPYVLTSGEVFRVEVDGKLALTRMAFASARRGGGEYYSVDGFELRNGLRAATGAD